MPTDDIDQLLRSADPWRGDVAGDLTDAVATQIVAAHRASRAKVRVQRRIGTIVAALLVAVPTTAYASYTLAARTGLFGAPGMTEEDTSEWINVCAKDFPTYFSTLPPPTDAPPSGHT